MSLPVGFYLVADLPLLFPLLSFSFLLCGCTHSNWVHTLGLVPVLLHFSWHPVVKHVDGNLKNKKGNGTWHVQKKKEKKKKKNIIACQIMCQAMCGHMLHPLFPFYSTDRGRWQFTCGNHITLIKLCAVTLQFKNELVTRISKSVKRDL